MKLLKQIVFLFLFAAALFTACDNGEKPRFAYSAGYDRIWMYTVHAATGRLCHNGYLKTGIGSIFVLADPKGANVYALNSSAHTIFIYQINPDNGKLVAALPPVDTGVSTRPDSMAINPAGTFAYVSDSINGYINVYRIETNGNLVQLVPFQVTTTGQPVSITVDPTGRYCYTAEKYSKDISVYSISQTDGSLSLVEHETAEVVDPRCVTADPSGKRLYVANYTGNNIIVYDINQTTGALDNARAFNAGNSAISIAIDPMGKFAYAANQSSNTVSVYKINSRTGNLTAVGTPVATGDGPRSITVDPSGTYVYVGNNSVNQTTAYKINGRTGALTIAGSVPGGSYAIAVTGGETALTRTPVLAFTSNGADGTVTVYTVNGATGLLTSGSSMTAGTQPTRIAVDPLQRYVYTSNMASNNISGYSFNSTTGAMADIIDLPVAAGTSPYAMAVDPTGRFAYAANHDTDNVSVYSISQDTGALVAGAGISAGDGPRDIAIDPTGRFLYVVNQTAATISKYKIDIDTGALTEVGTPITSSYQSHGLLVDPSGRFLYAVNNWSYVYIFSINAFSGELSILGAANGGDLPGSIAIEPSGRFLYVTSEDADGYNRIYKYAIVNNGGLAGLVKYVSKYPIDYLVVNPAGTYLYSRHNNDNRLCIWKINQSTGALSLAKTVTIETDSSSMQFTWTLK